MFKLFGNLKLKHWFWVIVIVCLVVCQVYCDVTIPSYTATIIEDISTPYWSNATRIIEIWKAGLSMLGFAFGSMISMVLVGYIAAYITSSLATLVREREFKKVLDFSAEEMNKFSTGSLITRISNDITQVQSAVLLVLRLAITAPVTAIWALLKIQAVNMELMFSSLAWILAMILSMIVLFLLVYPQFKKVQKYTDRLNSCTRSNIVGLRVVKAYNADRYEEDKFEIVNKDITKLNIFVNRTLGVMMPIMYLVMNGLVLTIYWLGSALIVHSSNGLELYEQLPMFVQYVMQIVMSFLLLIMLFIMVPRASVSAKRINEVLDTKITVIENTNSKDIDLQGNSLEFKNVSFKYPGAEQNIISNISFKVNEGETFAIIGSTGSGKSTLINLIPRFYDATEGEILIDGVNIKDLKLSALRKKLGYVPQKGVLFSGTVYENINFGEFAHKDATEKYAEVACASEFINKMEQGYETHIAQGGKNVSGGQRQRLSIARAIAVKPDIYIFDDSFSALDYKTDKLVRRNLKEYTKNAINIIVGQRIGSIMEADRILVLDNGICVGCDTHKELLKNCEVYREIALSQLSEKELGL